MELRILRALELTAVIVGQTFLLAAGWGFVAVVHGRGAIVLPDYLSTLIHSEPTATTWVVSLEATILSVTTATFLSFSLKEALRHRVHKPMSLIHLSSGIALARGSYLVSFRHLTPTLVTLMVFGLTKFLVSSWTALLAPTLVTWSIDASGWELDLTSSSFESKLQQELVQSGASLVRGNSTQIINLDGVLSGIATAQYSSGTPGIFNFNGAKYYISTGGVLPAAPGYNGATDHVSPNNTGLAFAGGKVPTHLGVNFTGGRVIHGLYREFVLQQQGLTANVTCHQADSTTGQPNLDASFHPVPVPLANGTTDYWLWAWNITSDCSEGLPAHQQYVTLSNSSTIPDTSSSGLLSTLVCPYPLGQAGLSWETFTVVTNASWRYGFLPLTVCTISPLITTSFVNYSNGIINTTVMSSRSLGSSNTNLTQFLAGIIDYQAWYTQGLTTNFVGDALYAIYVSASDNNDHTTTKDLANLLLRELEQYWRGVIEFSGTYLRSAFSTDPNTIPTDARIHLNGSEVITTMGWVRQSAVWGHTILPITAVALMIYVAIAYTLWHIFIKRSHDSFAAFDPSNPIHVMMVSSVKDYNGAKDRDSLDDWLNGFERGGMGKNEDLRVQLTDVAPYRKRLRVTND